MPFIDLFPTVIFNTQPTFISPNDTSNFKKFIGSINFKDQGINGQYSLNQEILDFPIFLKLKKYILDESKVYLNELGHIYEDIQISSSWVNLVDKNEHIHSHSHLNSYISGVYYLNDNSKITFYNPTDKKWFFAPMFKEAIKEFRDLHKITISFPSNTLLIFPSWLIHEVPFSEYNNRFSIAFNIIPKGEFGPKTGKLYIK
jgi:uncharacterized protein (TIGR02466 family)